MPAHRVPGRTTTGLIASSDDRVAQASGDVLTSAEVSVGVMSMWVSDVHAPLRVRVRSGTWRRRMNIYFDVVKMLAG
jgi:hypothetical protein